MTSTLLQAQATIEQEVQGHDPRLYETSSVATAVRGWDVITDEHFDFYQQEGYLPIDAAYSADEVESAKAGLLDLIGGKNPAFRGIDFEAKAAAKLDEITIEEKQDAVRKLMHFVDHDARLRAMAELPALLAIVQRLLGESPRLFQDMALVKPPHIGREKPWHQDKAYFDYPVETRVVGVWIALDEATIENGCMHMQAQGHRTGPIPHFKRRDWQICDTEIMGKPCVAVPLEPGGLLLFDGLIPHGTPTNFSGRRRKALQFHYIGESAQKVPTEARLAVFGGEGRDVEC